MPLARCKMKCWDGRLTKLYYEGELVEIPTDYELARHFEFNPELPMREEVFRPSMEDMDPRTAAVEMADPAIAASVETPKKRPPNAPALKVMEVAARKREEAVKAKEEEAAAKVQEE